MLYAALKQAARSGEKAAERMIGAVRERIKAGAPEARIDYVELVEAETLQPLSGVHPGALLAVAVFFGKTRLIDNIRLP